jgi:hypothetical protein
LLASTVDDPVGAGSVQVVDGAWQRRRRSDQPADGIGDDLHVHSVALMLPGVGPLIGDL